MTDPDRFERLRTGDLHDPGLVDVTTAHIAYVDGAFAGAALLDIEPIRADAAIAGAWIGLALARRRAGDASPAAALRARPELLLDLHRRLREQGTFVDPEPLARWLDPAAAKAGKEPR